jgi:hypothetical protein
LRQAGLKNLNITKKVKKMKIKKIYLKLIKLRKYIYLILICILCFKLSPVINAEQAGSSPDTGGAESVITKAYNYLLTKGDTYGASSSPDWTYNWGTYWNRIMYSATWKPDGTATESDVLSGKTFYSDSRTKKTGTATTSPPIDFSLEQYVEYDDGKASDYTEEEST